MAEIKFNIENILKHLAKEFATEHFKTSIRNIEFGIDNFNQ